MYYASGWCWHRYYSTIFDTTLTLTPLLIWSSQNGGILKLSIILWDSLFNRCFSNNIERICREGWCQSSTNIRTQRVSYLKLFSFIFLVFIVYKFVMPCFKRLYFESCFSHHLGGLRMGDTSFGKVAFLNTFIHDLINLFYQLIGIFVLRILFLYPS